MRSNKSPIIAAFIVVAVLIPRFAAAQGAMKGWVGVAYTTVGQTDREGTLVFTDYPVIESIEPNSPAERAGLEAGDTILAMNAQDLKRRPLPMAAMIQPGRKVIFRYKRGGEVRQAIVVVVPRPRGTSETFDFTMMEPPRRAPAPTPRAPREPGVYTERTAAEVSARTPAPPIVLPPMAFGFGPRTLPVAGAELTRLNAGLRSLVGLTIPGIFVVNVALGTPARESGLEPADVIIKADGTPVGDPGDLITALRESNGSSIRLQIVRKKKEQTITLRW